MKFNLLYLFLLCSFVCNAMEEDEGNVRCNTSLIEAYMGPDFDIQEESIIFSDYKDDRKHTMLLSQAARVLYQFRRDRCKVHDFRTALNVLFLNLKAEPSKDLSEKGIQVFQLWRLYKFDFFESDTNDAKSEISRKSAEKLNPKSELYVHESLAFEKLQKRIDEHSTLLDSLPAQCNVIKTNRVAYSMAFAMADAELLKTHKIELLRFKAKTQLRDAIINLRLLAQKKNSNPFELIEL